MSDLDRDKKQQNYYSDAISKNAEKPVSNVFEFSTSQKLSDNKSSEKLSRAFDLLKREAEELNW